MRIASIAVVTATVIGTTAVLGAAPAVAATVNPDPSTWANTDTARVVTVSTTNALLYKTDGASMSITGPGGGSDTYAAGGVTVDSNTNTVTGTFDMVPGTLPAGPGSYTLSVSTVAPAIPLDSGTVTITAAQPTISGSAAIQPSQTTSFEIDATTGTFAMGDTVSFAQGGTTSDQVILTSPTVGASTITGTLSAGSTAALGAYDVVVTDTAGGTATCTGCITVDNGPGAVTNLAAHNVAVSHAGLTWSAPSGSPTPTGYDIVVSTDQTATETDAGVTVTHSSPTATAAASSGLTAATKYYATVTGTSASGAGTPTQISFFTKQASALTIGRAPAGTTYPGTLTLSGNLALGADGSGDGIAGATVGLYAKDAGAKKYTKLTTVTTDGDGNYSYAFKPTRGAAYVATYAGTDSTDATPGIDAATSGVTSATVTQRITLKGKAVHHTRWLQLKGKVGPKQAGRRVVIYDVVGSKPKKFTRVTLNSKSRYKLVAKHVKVGHHSFVAKIKKTAGLEAATSDPVDVTK
ncbi:MAG: fibronectin type III domain-containing protein [Frankiaceae bacterium]|nr:fibronectin type III domain-containing protein [Frankiaceae bacterium]MBV9870262.1 fibronectin type III domain-containing protein [Frankiaceae bacterium]